jgi:hypothetical protein
LLIRSESRARGKQLFLNELTKMSLRGQRCTDRAKLAPKQVGREHAYLCPGTLQSQVSSTGHMGTQANRAGGKLAGGHFTWLLCRAVGEGGQCLGDFRGRNAKLPMMN